MRTLAIIELLLTIFLIGMLIYFYQQEKKGNQQVIDLLKDISNNTKK